MQCIRHVLYLLAFIVFFTGCFGQTKVKKQYAIYRSPQWEDVNLHGTEKNMMGFSEDLCFEIAQQEDIKIDLVTLKQETTLSMLDNKNVDAILTTTSPSIRNENEYLFSEPFFTFGSVLLLRSNDTLKRFREMKVKVIGFVRGFGSDLMTREDLGYIFRPYEQVVTAIEDLVEGRIEAVILDSIYGYQLASGLYANKIKVATPLFRVIEFRLAVKRGSNEELVPIFNSGLEKLKTSSLYQKMLLYWGLFQPPEKNVVANESN
jgi:ABC-type amino acid transport substrate-binding protein